MGRGTAGSEEKPATGTDRLRKVRANGSAVSRRDAAQPM